MSKQFMVGVLAVFLSLCVSLDAHAFSFFDIFHLQASPASFNASQKPLTENTILARARGLSPQVLTLALKAYHKLYHAGYDGRQMLTIIDYSRPSTERRLWVIDLKNFQVPFQTLVAHGKNSGGNIPDAFSDQPRSLASSIGVYLTGDTYMGKHGYSLRLNGLERGFNDTARAREVVVHAANYVSETFARLHGRLGRSWGCMALDPVVAPSVINEIKDGTVLFAYYPDVKWLHQSAYINA